MKYSTMLANRVSASQAIDFLHLVQNLKVSRTGALTCMLEPAQRIPELGIGNGHRKGGAYRTRGHLIPCRQQKGRGGFDAM